MATALTHLPEPAQPPLLLVEMVHGEKALQLCAKLHMGTVRMPEMIRRVEADMQRYGARAEEAERNERLDFKALSHALRALDQMSNPSLLEWLASSLVYRETGPLAGLLRDAAPSGEAVIFCGIQGSGKARFSNKRFYYMEHVLSCSM